MPMTVLHVSTDVLEGEEEDAFQLTIVDKLKFRDDVETDLGEVVLEHLQEHGKEVFGSPAKLSQYMSKQSGAGRRTPAFRG